MRNTAEGQSEDPVGDAADDAHHMTSSKYEYGFGAYIIILYKPTSKCKAEQPSLLYGAAMD